MPHPPARPATVAHLATMPWQDFERFATLALRDYYRGFRLELVPTQLQVDGARDAEATYIFGPPHVTASEKRTLTIVFKLWVEVKQIGTGANVDLSRIGKNLVRATNEEVQKLIIVTNADYTSGMRREVERFAHRVALDYALVNGTQLLQIARGEQPLFREQESKPVRVTQKKRKPTAPPPRDPWFEVRCTLSPDPFLPFGEDTSFAVTRGMPFYLLIDIVAESVPVPVEVTVEVEPKKDRCSIYPYSRSGFAAKEDAAIPVGVGDCRRKIFVVFAEEGVVRADDFEIRISVPDGFANARVDVSRAGHADVSSSAISDWIPPSREKLLDEIARDIGEWFGKPSFATRLLIADAGTGKSHCVAHLRRRWLDLGAREIALDGGRSASDVEVVQRLFQEVFPLDAPALGDDQADDVAEWLTTAGMSPLRARQIAHAVCRERRLDLNAQCLSEIMASLLRRAARRRGIVLLFEDLHKCAPSALILLRETIRQLRNTAPHVLVVATTRPHSMDEDSERRQRWSADLSNLAGDFRSTRIPTPTQAEAVELIRKTIPTLQEHHARQIVSQVGCTPLGARESVQFLRASGIAAMDANLGVLRIDRPEKLRRAMELDEFKDVTGWRIRRFLETRPDWLELFVVAAACVGRFFPLQTCLTVAGMADGVDARRKIQECRDAELLQPSPHTAGEWAFDHDVIRAAVLNRTGALQQYAAEALFTAIGSDAAPELRGSLAYQAGLGERAVELTTTAGELAARRGRHADAVKMFRVALMVLRPVEAPLESLQDLDEAIRVAPVPAVDWPRTRVMDTSLQVVRQVIRSFGEIGEAASETMARSLSLAAMLAKALRDVRAQADIERWWGIHEFDIGNLERSLDRHRKADELFARMASDDLRGERAQNLVRIAIVLRQLGQFEESEEALHHAERTRDPGDLAAFVRIAQNTGALHFYVDLHRVGRYWTKALRAARTLGSPERIAHCVIDVALVDLLEGRYDAARSLLDEARRITEELALDNSHIRVLLHGAILDMIEGNHETARDQLFDAEDLAERTSNFRRLWRLRANLATAFELLGDWEASYAADRSAVASLRELLQLSKGADAKMERLNREVFPFANVILRASVSPLHAKLAAELLQRELDVGQMMLDAMQNTDTPRAAVLRRHLRSFGAASRFIVTE